MGFTVLFIMVYGALLFWLFGYLVLPLLNGKKSLLER
jgi:hypothetical protein